MHRRLLLFILTLALLFPWFKFKGDDSMIIDSLEIYLRPEYDQPSVSVTYKIGLDPIISLPATLQIHIPTSVGNLDYVTTKELDGTTVNTPYTREIQGDWSLFTITATGLEVDLDYHDPNLTIDGNSRTYTFELPRDYSITAFSVMVLQPIGATETKITPSLGDGIQNNNGTVTYEANLGAIASGPNYTITLSYNKTNDAYSSSVMKVQPAEPLYTDIRGRSPSLNRVLILIVVGLLIVLLICICIWYWRPKQKETDYLPRKRSFFVLHKKTLSNTANEGNYCHQCGNRTQAGDIYCRMCGSKLHDGKNL